MDYSTLQSISGVVGLIIFIVAFAGVLFYALRPKNKAKFENAARLPLEDEQNPDNDQNSNTARDGDCRG